MPEELRLPSPHPGPPPHCQSQKPTLSSSHRPEGWRRGEKPYRTNSPNVSRQLKTLNPHPTLSIPFKLVFILFYFKFHSLLLNSFCRLTPHPQSFILFYFFFSKPPRKSRSSIVKVSHFCNITVTNYYL